MKREYVIPDLLASITADALFAGAPHNNAVASPASGHPSAMQRLTRWFKRTPHPVADTPAPATTRHTLTDDWAGGWYARTRLLQAATLAQYPGDGSGTPATNSDNPNSEATPVGRRAGS